MASQQFQRELAVPADPSVCWTTLTDVERLARWVTVLHEVVEIDRLRKYTAVLQDQVGPFKMRANLDIVVDVLDEGRRVRIQASGQDRQVGSQIAVTAELVLSERDSGTTIAVDGTYNVTGRVATLGGGVIKKKAGKILDEFFASAQAELSA